MNNEMQIFKNSEFGELGVLEIDGKPYFPAAACAKALGYKRPADAITAHCKGSVKYRVLTKGGEQELKFLPEGDLYRLITHSKLPAAERFEKWVFDEVLPSIRKHGGYIAGQESMSGDELMARAILFAQSKINELESKNKQLLDKIQIDKPKVDFAEAVGSCKGTISVGTFANVLFDTCGIKLGRNKLFKWMQENHILKKDTTPYQIYLNRGWFEVIEIPIRQIGKLQPVTRITPKGQQALFQKLKISYSGGDKIDIS